MFDTSASGAALRNAPGGQFARFDIIYFFYFSGKVKGGTGRCGELRYVRHERKRRDGYMPGLFPGLPGPSAFVLSAFTLGLAEARDRRRATLALPTVDGSRWT